MKKERSFDNEPDKISTESVERLIDQVKLDEETREWLTGESSRIREMIETFSDNADVFDLHPDLRENPELILSTILNSAELLHEYQKDYDRALENLANANGIETDDLRSIPNELEKVSLARERKKLNEHLKNGGVIAIGLMGSGASGKGTVGKRAGMERVVNVTTRKRRPTEEHGKDYFYIREMEPKTAESLDTDTGFNVVGTDQGGQPIFETDEAGNPINYFDKYGPYLTTVHREGRARHGTPVNQFQELYGKGEKAIFFEHGPVQVKEAGESLPSHIENAKVLPVCILPPERGVLALAMRVAVRTYGDPVHKDQSVQDSYKIKESYIESTIGRGQIAELAMTADFVEGENPLGIAYIVNDDLQEAVDKMKSLVE